MFAQIGAGINFIRPGPQNPCMKKVHSPSEVPPIDRLLLAIWGLGLRCSFHEISAVQNGVQFLSCECKTI